MVVVLSTHKLVTTQCSRQFSVWLKASECPDVKNYKWRLNPVWHRMLYSCTHMATVGFKGLIKHVRWKTIPQSRTRHGKLVVMCWKQ